MADEARVMKGMKITGSPTLASGPVGKAAGRGLKKASPGSFAKRVKDAYSRLKPKRTEQRSAKR